MRYIIDAAVLQAELLNRTLVLPSFVYARACEYYMYVISFLPLNCSFTIASRCRVQHGLCGLCDHGQQR
jgi:hypothetical protein